MYIIIGKDKAEKLEENYIILPLDRVSVDGIEDRAYCVITSDKIPLMDLPVMHQWTSLHIKLIEEYDKDNYKYCLDAISHLYGKFGGEMDSFYDELRKRLENS